ncbi:MAG: TonB-dependent receptor [Syntrophorhabdales bacterium]
MSTNIAIITCALCALICVSNQSWCEEQNEPMTMDEVVVTGKEEKGPLEVKTSQPDTESTLNREALSLYGGGGINIFKAIDVLPSVNFQSPDPYGLSDNFSIRVRGQTRVESTIEGLSLMNYGLDPGPADLWMFDTENLSSVTVYKGAVAAENSLGPYNSGGTVDRTILRPSDKIGLTVDEYHGSFDFNKVFTRFDSGLLPTGTKLFASFSQTGADKWKGPGDFNDVIGSFGIVQNFSPDVKVEVFGTYTNPEVYEYRSLTYAQSRDLSIYNRYDFNPNLTANSKQDINYYGYNRDTFTDRAFFANLEIKTAGDGKLTFKPYYVRENGYTLAGVGSLLGSPGIRDWEIVHNSYGLASQYNISLLGIDTTLGYWYADQEPPGPPTAQKVYRATTSDTLTYAGWAVLANPTENHEWHSPYLLLGKKLDDFYIKAGLRYVYEKMPSIDLYNGSATVVPNVSYLDALGYSNVIPAGSVHGPIVREWLPNFGITYAPWKELNTYFNYGRNFGRSAFDSWTAYASNPSTFASRGLTEQYLWDKLKPTISDNFDLGARYNRDSWYVTGALFSALYHDYGVSVADPALGGLAYTQNIASATSYGAETEIVKYLTKKINLFATGSYNKFEFTDNIVAATNTVTMAKGKQVPDVPVYEARLGGTARFYDFAISPILRYTGSRYADVTDVDRVPAYTTVDVDLRYTKKDLCWCESFSAGITFLNLLNARYISYLNLSDDTKQGAASFYAGAPLTVMGTVQVKF